MKKQLQHLKLFLPALLLITALSSPAQEFILTTTAANTVSSKSTIDLPGLNGNPQAVIVATPFAGTEVLNPHPIGAWYYNGKWNIFNTDHAVMPLGAKYLVQYFPQPSTTHFLHVIPSGSFATVPRTYLDYPSLDNKPNVQVKILQNHAPDNRVFYLNQSEAKASYEGGKWFIQNVNGTALYPNTSYNIVITSSGTIGSVIDKTNLNTTGKTAVPSLPTGNAGGDLSGNYPNPTVQKLIGRPLSTVAPVTGQILKWNGTEWASADDNVGTGGTNNPESWKKNGTNVYNTNTGNVGIGTTNPNAPIGFPAVLGKKITLYPGTTGDVGFGVAGNRLQIYTDNPNADVAIGYDAAGTFNERFAVKSNGAIAVSGDAGQSGQVLTSSGAGSPPTWKQLLPAAKMQTFFKLDNSNLTLGQTELNDNKPERIISELSHSIVLTINSRLIISAGVSATGPFCPLGCTDGLGSVNLRINNTDYFHARATLIAGWYSVSGTISNYMIDLNPGTYNIEFVARHVYGKSGISIYGDYSSIMVIPLQ